MTSLSGDAKGWVVPYRVLFVDDEPRVTSSIRHMLRREPYEVLVAHSAAEAFEVLATNQVDVVVSDERMPDVAGSRLLAQVRNLYPETVRIILTGQASLESAVSAINNAAVFRFLLKPCSPEELKQCLAEATTAISRHRDERRRARRGSTRPASAAAQLDKEERFERALEQLWIAVQPIVDVHERRIFGFEALVRTREASVPNPMAFFGLGHDLGRAHELDRRIRSQIPKLARSAAPETAFFVNLDPFSLNDDTLYSPLAPLSRMASKVVLEITERSSLHLVEELPERIRALRNLGFRIALDDLGAGYAGLTTLTSLNPDIVKFDMDLVRDIQESPTKTKLVASMNVVCRELNIETIAEGVETTAEYRHLLDLECALFQGFLFSRPCKPFPQVSWPEMRTTA